MQVVIVVDKIGSEPMLVLHGVNGGVWVYFHCSFLS